MEKRKKQNLWPHCQFLSHKAFCEHEPFPSQKLINTWGVNRERIKLIFLELVITILILVPLDLRVDSINPSRREFLKQRRGIYWISYQCSVNYQCAVGGFVNSLRTSGKSLSLRLRGQFVPGASLQLLWHNQNQGCFCGPEIPFIRPGQGPLPLQPFQLSLFLNLQRYLQMKYFVQVGILHLG